MSRFNKRFTHAELIEPDKTSAIEAHIARSRSLGASNSDRYTGKRLGLLVSRIVAEVLLGILEADPDSYVHQNWQPPKIKGVLSDSDVRLDTLSKMMFYAKDYTTPR
jgi:hypothetical protein